MAGDASLPGTPDPLADRGPIAAVHVSRTFPVSREEVYRAWTEPETLRRWFGTWGSMIQGVEMDVRVGGNYKISMRWPPTFRTIAVVGTFLEVEPPERLVYTFAWEPVPIPAFGMGDSRVTVQFNELEGGTEVRLTHELLDKARLRSFHRFGWKGTFHRLAGYL
jgi:uncharacterized protein YndB with AHSA1/START domain